MAGDLQCAHSGVDRWRSVSPYFISYCQSGDDGGAVHVSRRGEAGVTQGGLVSVRRVLAAHVQGPQLQALRLPGLEMEKSHHDNKEREMQLKRQELRGRARTSMLDMRNCSAALSQKPGEGAGISNARRLPYQECTKAESSSGTRLEELHGCEKRRFRELDGSERTSQLAAVGGKRLALAMMGWRSSSVYQRCNVQVVTSPGPRRLPCLGPGPRAIEHGLLSGPTCPHTLWSSGPPPARHKSFERRTWIPCLQHASSTPPARLQHLYSRLPPVPSD